MSLGLDCARAEELLSDHYEETLEGVLRADLEAHLASCGNCYALREALGEVMAALAAYPDLEPSSSLAERAASAALVRPRSLPRPVPLWRGFRIPPRILAAAAGLTLAATGVLFMALGQGPAPLRATAARLGDRASSATAFVVERKDRLMEDLRILRVVISAAFEGRVDRMNDRVDDYRRLLERRRSLEQEQGKSGASKGSEVIRSAWRASFSLSGSSLNDLEAVHVRRLVRHGGLDGAGRTGGVTSPRSDL